MFTSLIKPSIRIEWIYPQEVNFDNVARHYVWYLKSNGPYIIETNYRKIKVKRSNTSIKAGYLIKFKTCARYV